MTKTLRFRKKADWPLVLGLDAGSESLKYLLLSRRNGSYSVQGFGKLSFPESVENAPDAAWKKLAGLLRKSGIGKNVKSVLGFEGPGLIMKKESFPSLSKKELLQTIQFSLRKELGAMEEMEVLVGYEDLGGEPEKGNRYLTMGVMEEAVLGSVGPMAHAGFIPAKVTPVIQAMMRLLSLLPELSLKKTIAMLDIGTKRSMLVFFHEGRLDFYREILVGGEDFTKAITGIIFHEGKAIQYSHEEAEMFKAKYGYPLGFMEGTSDRGAPFTEVGTMMRPVVERLTGEIQRSIDFYKEQTGNAEVEAVYLLGGGAQLLHLPEVISEKIAVPVDILPFPRSLKIGNKKNTEHFKTRYLEQAVSLALAMEPPEGMNFLPRTYVQARRSHQLMRGLTFGALGMAASLVWFSLYSYGSIQSLGAEAAGARKRVASMEQKGKRFASLVIRKNEMEAALMNVNGSLKQDQMVLQVLRAVSHAIPDRLSLSYLSYGQEKPSEAEGASGGEETPWILRMKGLNHKPPNDLGIFIAQFIVALEKTGYFTQVKLEKGIANKAEDQYWFEIVGILDMKGHEGVQK